MQTAETVSIPLMSQQTAARRKQIPATLSLFIFAGTKKWERIYVPWFQLPMYSICSGVSSSKEAPTDSSFKRAMYSSISVGTS